MQIYSGVQEPETTSEISILTISLFITTYIILYENERFSRYVPLFESMHPSWPEL